MLLNKHLGVSSISNYAEASIDSAIRGLDIAADLIAFPELPKRLPFVTNSVFNSALAIGLAFFGDFDRSFPLRDSMDKSERILGHLSTYEPQARRYAEIVGYLSKATKKYVEKRDRSSMQDRRQKKNDLFGVVGLNPTRPSSHLSSTSPVPVTLRNTDVVPHLEPLHSRKL